MSPENTSSTQIHTQIHGAVFQMQIYKFALPHTVQLFKTIGNWEINHELDIWI